MAYGQTGSGKTHTMLGDHSVHDNVSLEELSPERKHGIIPRSAEEVIRYVHFFFLTVRDLKHHDSIVQQINFKV